MRLRARLLVFLLLAAVSAFAVPAAGQVTDTDSDTMPDAWETFFGLDPNNAADATGDPDGDGLTNAQEYAAGRHPFGRFARYFAEGATGYFDTSLAVLNLNTTDTAHVSIALLDESGGVTPHQITLAPRARQSVSLNAVLGTSAAVSIIVESDVAIAADRAMTWGPSGVGLSLDSGAPAPATTWYFAEGATGPFLLYYLFENPGATPANVTVRYLREGGTPISRSRTLPPHSRTTVFVNADDPGVANTSLGAEITSDVPILAERAMYVEANGTFAGGSASSGSPVVSTTFYFGEGATGPFFHAFLSLVNPLASPATALVTYHLSDGTTASKTYPVPSNGRRTIYFNQEATTDPALAALANGPVWFSINSTGVIAAERAMWWSTWPWYEGHAATGNITSDVAWGVAEGRDGGPENDQTYVLVGNTTGTAGQVRVSLIPDAGAPQTRDLTIAAGARLTINVGGLFGLTGASRFSVTVESLGASPVPLAVDYARYRSVNGVPFSGGGAAPAVPLLPADAAPSVTATTPADGAPGASSTNNLVVTFNESVNAAAGAFSLACPTGSPIALTVVTASPATQFTLDPAVPLPASTPCTLMVLASAITDVDSTDPPDVMTANAVITFTTAAENAPAVSTTAPASGAVQVGLAANLTITFSEPVDVVGNWFQIVCATSGTRTVGDTAVSGGPTTFTIDPNTDFVAGELCTVTVVAAQVTDQDPVDPPDAMAADHDFAFTADVAPTVTATTPANGAVTVGTATPLTVTFSEPVTLGATWFQIVCATSGTRNVTDTIVTGGPTAFTIDPNTDFAAGELCTVTITAAQVSDQDAGDPPDTLAANYVFAFTTDVTPTVTATTPTNGATNATTTGNLTVTFSEPVTVAGNWFQIVCGTSGTRTLADTVVTGGPTLYTIDPTVDFAAGEACTVTITAASIADQDAGDPPDALSADYVFGFTIDAAPTVAATTPTNGATTTTTTDLTVTFSEPVNVTGNWFQVVCATTGTRNVADTVVTGGPTVFAINPNANFAAGELCTVTIVAAQVADQDAADPPDTLAANYVFSVTVDAAPAVVSSVPATGATAIAANASVALTFNEAVTAGGGAFTMACTTSGAHTFVVSGGPTTLTLNPDVDFAAGETCTVTVLAASVTDQDGFDPPDTMAANHVVTFTIEAAPAVSATTPANGSAQATSTGNLTIDFTEPVAVTGAWFQIVCTTTGTRNVADTVVSGGPSTFTIDPNVDFAAGETCTVTITAGAVTDLDAIDPPDAMTANHVFSFTIDVAPNVTATTPANGAVDGTTTGNLTITFSEPVNVNGNWFQIVCTTSGTRNVTDTVVTGGPTVFTINPTVDFAAGETCTTTIAAALVSDQDAADPPDTLAAAYVFSFAIDAQPTVTGTTPVNGATTSTNTDVTVTFSEPVVLTGSWFQIVCATSGTRTTSNASVTGGPTTYTINPNVDFAGGESCVATVFAAQVGDSDAADPPDTLAADYVFSFTPDAAPSVASTTPVSAATVAASTNLSVTFSEAVNAAGASFSLTCSISGAHTFALTGGPTTWTLNPNTDFAPAETCTWTTLAAAVTDQDGFDPPDNMTANHVVSFTVDARPSVTTTTPTNGATQVATTANPSVTFSEPVDVTGSWFSISCSVSGAHTATVSGGSTTFTLNPDADFASADLCTVTVVAAQVTDQDAIDPPDTMAANFVFTFTVDTAPSVTTTTPTNGATGVSAATNITVNFSENVNAAGGAFTLVCGTSGSQAFAFVGASTNVASITLNPTANLPAGEFCTVTVVAAGITDADAGDPPDTMLANYVFTFAVPPDAVNDARGATGNVSINTATTGFSVLSNDIGPDIVVTAFDATSVLGGTVSVIRAGVFTYTPPVGYEGIDSFTYTIMNGAGSDTAAVNITVSGMLWFIDNTAAACTTIAGGCGRRATPFSTLPSFEAVNGGATMNGGDVIDPEAGDAIFIATGAGNYVGPLTLEASQRVIGQGATGTVTTLAGITFAPDSVSVPATGGVRPTITSGGAGVTLASNDQLHGLSFTTTGTAVNGAGNVGTFTMSDIAITNTSGQGVSFTGGGTVTSGGINTIQTTTGVPLTVTNTSIAAGGLTFRSIAANGAANGIVLNATGSIGGLTVTGAGNTTQGGDNSGGTIQSTTGDAISLTNASNVSLTNMRLLNIAGVGVQGIDASNLGGSNLFRAGRMTNVGSAGSGDGNGITLVNTSTNLTLFAVENSVFQNALSGTSHVLNNPNGAIAARLDVRDSIFEGLEAIAVQSNSNSNAIVTTNITNNIFRNASANGQGGTIVATGAGSLGSNTFVVSSNTYFGLNNGVADGANAGTAAFQTTGGLLSGSILNNTLGTAADNNGDRRGIEVVSEPDVSANGNTGAVDIIIDGNVINRYTNREAILIDLREDTLESELIIRNNNIGNLGGFVGDVGGLREAIDVQVRGEATYSLDLLMTNNIVTVTSDIIGINIEVNADAASPGAQTMNAHITNNTIVQLGAGTNLTARTRTSDPLVVLNLNITGNTMEGAAGSLAVEENSGDVNVQQTSSANLSSVNGNVTVTLVGAPDFGVATPPPPAG